MNQTGDETTLIEFPRSRPAPIFTEDLSRPFFAAHPDSRPPSGSYARSGRALIAVCSGLDVPPGQRARVTIVNPATSFRVERIVLGDDASDWGICDIQIGGRSQFSQGGDIPGEMFAATALDTFVSIETAQRAMNVSLVVARLATGRPGAPFTCVLLGEAVGPVIGVTDAADAADAAAAPPI